TEHQGLAKSFRVQADAVDWSITSEHPGWELVWTEDEKIEIGFRGRNHSFKRESIFVCNAREPHTEIFDGSPKQFKALVIDTKLIDGLLSEGGWKSDDVLFDDFRLDLSPKDFRDLQSFDR